MSNTPVRIPTLVDDTDFPTELEQEPDADPGADQPQDGSPAYIEEKKREREAQ